MIIVVAGVEMGALLKPSTAIGGVGQPGVARDRRDLGRRHLRDPARGQGSALEGRDAGQPAGTPRAASVRIPTSRIRIPGRRPRGSRPSSALACLVTLGAGVLLEVSGNDLANRLGINGVIFGATVLADRDGAAGDQLGARRRAARRQRARDGRHLRRQRLPGLPLPRRRPRRRQAGAPSAGDLNAWLAALGVALTAIYGFGVISRPMHCRWRLGPGLASSRSSSSASASPASSSSRRRSAADAEGADVDRADDRLLDLTAHTRREELGRDGRAADGDRREVRSIRAATER